jgi:hypothetical protein
MVAGEAVGVDAIEVGAAELVIRLAVAQHVIGDDQDAVGDRDDGLLVTAPLDQSPILGREVGVAFENGAAGTLHERLAQEAPCLRARRVAAQEQRRPSMERGRCTSR